MPQSLKHDRKQNSKIVLERVLRRLLVGFDYAFLLGEYGENSQQAKDFLNRNSTAKDDRDLVCEVLSTLNSERLRASRK